MTKSKEYWIFGMISLLCACVASGETLIGFVAILLCAICGVAYLIAAIYFCYKGQ